MKKTACLAALFLWFLPCCGCTSDTSVSSATDNSLDITSTSSYMTETVLNSADSETSAAQSEVSTDDTNTTLLFQGGIGDEKDAATPKPEYFTFRFQPDSFSARLAGGNYQTIPCDLSEGFQHTIDSDYYLDDYNADGNFDLYLPVKYEDSRVCSYAVFCWDPLNEKFLTEPVMIDAET